MDAEVADQGFSKACQLEWIRGGVQWLRIAEIGVLQV